MNDLMLPNRCHFALASAASGVVELFVGCDTLFPLKFIGLIYGTFNSHFVHLFQLFQRVYLFKRIFVATCKTPKFTLFYYSF